MRPGLPYLMLLASLAAPLSGQTCRKAPPPFLPTLFPEAVAGMPLEFSMDPGGGCMALYRPGDPARRATAPWAVVTVAANSDPELGESAEGIRAKLATPESPLLTMADWPVMLRVLPKGDEFTALKGSVSVTVLVKNGDQGAGSQALAARFFAQILPKVPCG